LSLIVLIVATVIAAGLEVSDIVLLVLASLVVADVLVFLAAMIRNRLVAFESWMTIEGGE
jgi:hypothetical protein